MKVRNKETLHTLPRATRARREKLELVWPSHERLMRSMRSLHASCSKLGDLARLRLNCLIGGSGRSDPRSSWISGVDPSQPARTKSTRFKPIHFNSDGSSQVDWFGQIRLVQVSGMSQVHVPVRVRWNLNGLDLNQV